MKNIIKIVTYNLIFILVCILFLEFISFSILWIQYRNQIKDCMKSYKYKNKFSLLYEVYNDLSVFTDENNKNYFRKPTIKTNNKRPILLFGCSFAAGDILDDKHTFSAILSNYTGRTAYNRGFPGSGPQIMLYQLSSEKFRNLVPDSEYIIYLYAADAINRTAKTRNWPFLWQICPKYKLTKNNNLKLIKLNWLLAHSYTYRLLESNFPKLYGKNYCNKLFFEIIRESYTQSQKLYPDSKFIVFAYETDMPMKEAIEEIGIKVITLKDITDENLFQLKYQISEYNSHPNEKAWEYITPLLLKEAGIQ